MRRVEVLFQPDCMANTDMLRVGHAFFKARATPIGNQHILPILQTLSAWCRNCQSGFRLRIRETVTKVGTLTDG